MSICTPPEETRESSTLAAVKLGDIKTAFWETFGFGYGMSNRDVSIESKGVSLTKKKLRKMELDLAKAMKTKDYPIQRDLKKRIKETKEGIKLRETRLKESKEKAPIIKRIEANLVNHVSSLADKSFYQEHIDPYTIFPVLKEYIERSRTIVFQDIADLDSGTLASIERDLYKKLAKIQDKSEKEMGPISVFKNTVMDPLWVSTVLDPTGASNKPIKKAKSWLVA